MIGSLGLIVSGVVPGTVMGENSFLERVRRVFLWIKVGRSIS